MTTTTFFKFPDEATARQVLQPEGYYIPEETQIEEDADGTKAATITPGDYRTADLGWAMDVIGILYEPGTYDDDGKELTPPVPLPGWHINFAGPYANGLDAYKVDPVTPHRKFL